MAGVLVKYSTVGNGDHVRMHLETHPPIIKQSEVLNSMANDLRFNGVGNLLADYLASMQGRSNYINPNIGDVMSLNQISGEHTKEKVTMTIFEKIKSIINPNWLKFEPSDGVFDYKFSDISWLINTAALDQNTYNIPSGLDKIVVGYWASSAGSNFLIYASNEEMTATKNQNLPFKTDGTAYTAVFIQNYYSQLDITLNAFTGGANVACGKLPNECVVLCNYDLKDANNDIVYFKNFDNEDLQINWV